VRRLAPIGAAAAAVALAGCAQDTSPPAPTTVAQPPGRPDAAAKRVAQQYLDGYSSKRAAGVCAALTAAARSQLATHGGSCLRAISDSLKGRTFPTLDVRLATVRGNTATATIVGQPRMITLTREGGGWKVSNGGS
jgi:hypothetical protein